MKLKTSFDMFNTPILFLIFNREDTAQRVFDAICQQKPKYLFVAADGARKNVAGEEKTCKRVRDIIKQINWDCEVKTLFREENVGCKTAVSSAITWFFDQVEYGIILEDDCLPDPTFFPFCEELLIRYKDDDRVGHIGGNCFFNGVVSAEFSYDFCSIAHIWGWATWRRVWKNFDLNFAYWDETIANKKKRKALFKYLYEEIYFSSFIPDALKEKKGFSVWDVQYHYTLRVQNQLSVYPSVNLVSNIGITSPKATHKASRKTAKKFRKSYPITFPLKHPSYMLPNENIDKITCRKYFFSYKRLLRYILRI